MEQRALLAAVISLLILILYQGVILPRMYPPQPVAVEQDAAVAPAGSGTSDAAAPAAQPATGDTVAAPASAPAAAPAAPAKTIQIETEHFIAQLTTRGARFSSFLLKRYHMSVDPSSPLQELILPTTDGQRPVGIELRGSDATAGGKTIVLSDSESPYVLSTAVEQVTLTGEQTLDLDFTWNSPAGPVHKTFTFRGDQPDFAIGVRADHLAAPYTEVGVSYVTATKTETETIFDRASYFTGKSLVERHLDSHGENKELGNGEIVANDPPWMWGTIAGAHFIAAMIPKEGTGARLWLKHRGEGLEQKILFPLDNGNLDQRLSLYVGSKRIQTLEAVGHNLSRAVDLGRFSFIALPLLWLLRKLHQFSGNYGVDIILLTVLIKLAFWPLTLKSFRSMKAVQKLQPLMNDLKEKYKDDQQQMNKEIMELYRRHGVNPLGGCLPMVVQMPVFIGLYSTLSNAVELRHAPFALWIHDLSAPDRLGSLAIPFVTPPGIPVLTLLMGASMFLQQKMTPASGDPTQRQMMMIMPLMFTFMFLNFPAGLSLYWTVNNVLTVAQQYYINRASD